MDKLNKEIMENINKILNKPKIRICPICNKKLSKGVSNNRKYHKECAEIVKRAQSKKYSKKRYSKLTEEQKERMKVKNQIKNNIKNPSCIFHQGHKCVKKALQFDGFKIYPRGSTCPIFPRDKCPNFKSAHPEIYAFIKKNKNKLQKKK